LGKRDLVARLSPLLLQHALVERLTELLPLLHHVGTVAQRIGEEGLLPGYAASSAEVVGKRQHTSQPPSTWRGARRGGDPSRE
jgi:hypothetical protein